MNESNPCDAALAELLTLTVEVNQWGTTIYCNHLGQKHRVHGPAVIRVNGGKSWWLNGKRHRTDGPAVERANGNHEWWVNDRRISENEFRREFLNASNEAISEMESLTRTDDDYSTTYRNHLGQLHRIHGPAVTCGNGTTIWYKDDLMHRTTGPAYVTWDGEYSWWANGKLHREDGPAVVKANGQRHWYLNGQRLKKKEFNELLQSL